VYPCRGEVQYEGVTYPARTIVATGQVTSHDEGPVICVWDARVGSFDGEPELARIPFEKSSRGICALGFSYCGTMLTSVEMDNPHTVTVWDWRRGKKLGEGRGFNGEPIQVTPFISVAGKWLVCFI
jgi:microtubule-associated protein-like 6